jgi:hypothetical protein
VVNIAKERMKILRRITSGRGGEGREEHVGLVQIVGNLDAEELIAACLTHSLHGAESFMRS